MKDFSCYSPVELIMRKDIQKETGKYIKKYGGHRVLLHHDDAINITGIYEEITNSLVEAGLSFIDAGGVVPNPRLSLINECIERCKEEDIDFILAVGGGSVIDSSKAIALGCFNGQNVEDIIFHDGVVKGALPVGTVVTLAGTASEISGCCVITRDADMKKRDFSNHYLYPKFSLLNPSLTCTLPIYQTACGIADTLSHYLEQYFTVDQNSEMTDRLLEAGMKNIIEYGRKTIHEPDNYMYRSEVMWSATMAQHPIMETGRQADWSSHFISYDLTVFYHLPHGAALAVVLPAWMKYIMPVAMERIAKLGRTIFPISNQISSRQAAEQCITNLENFFHDIGLKTRLSALNIKTDRFHEMAVRSVDQPSYVTAHSGILGELAPLCANDVEKIYQLAY